MVERGNYTSDIHPCYEAFTSRWPEHEADMRQVVGWVERPTTDALEVIGFLEGFGQWMIARSDEWLDEHNPERTFALPLT